MTNRTDQAIADTRDGFRTSLATSVASTKPSSAAAWPCGSLAKRERVPGTCGGRLHLDICGRRAAALARPAGLLDAQQRAAYSRTSRAHLMRSTVPGSATDTQMARAVVAMSIG